MALKSVSLSKPQAAKAPEAKPAPVSAISLRPESFAEFPGQARVKKKLQVFVEAACSREEALDHVLLSGPPGLGKTTLAHIIGKHLGVSVCVATGPGITKKGELAAILTSLKPKGVLFIDEVHRLPKEVEEYLYSAMEDFRIDIITGEGLGARSMSLPLAPFTLVGATTRAGLLKPPFRDRFGICERLDFYEPAALARVLARSATLLCVRLSEGGAYEIAMRARGTPRVANRLLRRVRDFAKVWGVDLVDQAVARKALQELEVDTAGLAPMDRNLLALVHQKFAGGPVGIETLAAALNEESRTLEEVYEPFLLKEGFLQKTPRGRMLGQRALEHLGWAK